MNLTRKKTKFSQISVVFLLLFGLIGVCFAQEIKPLTILEKPRAAYTDVSVCIQGTVRLRVEFLASGEIGKISPISTLPYGLTENAIEAASKIKFEPEIKNGKLISKFMVVEYAFVIYEENFREISQKDEKAEVVLRKAVENLGGEKYLNAKSQIGRGKFSVLSGGTIVSFQNFIDVVSFPDKERTEFKSGGSKTVQTNVRQAGWIFDGNALTIKDQSEEQVNNFKRGIRTGLDNLLRGNWRKEDAKLEYAGKRQATLGTRNDVLKLIFDDGFVVEFEFSDKGLPMKSVYKRTNPDNEELNEEDRYAQFVIIEGIKTPYIIDHFSNGTHTSRINYESVEFNKQVPDSIFAKPSNVKELKKDLKL